ncbi:hypothetical protein COEX109129_36460 [Corallococcus exiguus]
MTVKRTSPPPWSCTGLFRVPVGVCAMALPRREGVSRAISVRAPYAGSSSMRWWRSVSLAGRRVICRSVCCAPTTFVHSMPSKVS